MKIYELFQNPKAFCKGYYALSSTGLNADHKFPVHPLDCDAVAWCVQGAIDKCYPGNEANSIRNRLKEALASLWPQLRTSLQGFNDNPATTVEMVRELAIKADV